LLRSVQGQISRRFPGGAGSEEIHSRWCPWFSTRYRTSARARFPPAKLPVTMILEGSYPITSTRWMYPVSTSRSAAGKGCFSESRHVDKRQYSIANTLGKKENYVTHAFGTNLLVRAISAAYNTNILDTLELCTNHQIIPTSYQGYSHVYHTLVFCQRIIHLFIYRVLLITPTSFLISLSHICLGSSFRCNETPATVNISKTALLPPQVLTYHMSNSVSTVKPGM